MQIPRYCTFKLNIQVSVLKLSVSYSGVFLLLLPPCVHKYPFPLLVTLGKHYVCVSMCLKDANSVKSNPLTSTTLVAQSGAI